jgi:hypothetical protein
VIEHVVVQHLRVAGEGGVGAAAIDVQIVLQVQVVEFAAPVGVEILADETAEGAARFGSRRWPIPPGWRR